MNDKNPLKPATIRSHCGSLYGYRIHIQNGEEKCPACFTAKQAANRRSYEKKRAGTARPQKVRSNDTGACGTDKGYIRHRRRGEKACEPCAAAHRETKHAQKHNRRIRDLGPSTRAWLDQAICAQVGGAAWDASTPTDKARICRRCPVLAECLAWGLATQDYGGDVYGGRWVERNKIRQMPADTTTLEETAA